MIKCSVLIAGQSTILKRKSMSHYSTAKNEKINTNLRMDIWKFIWLWSAVIYRIAYIKMSLYCQTLWFTPNCVNVAVLYRRWFIHTTHIHIRNSGGDRWWWWFHMFAMGVFFAELINWNNQICSSSLQLNWVIWMFFVEFYNSCDLNIKLLSKLVAH